MLLLSVLKLRLRRPDTDGSLALAREPDSALLLWILLMTGDSCFNRSWLSWPYLCGSGCSPARPGSAPQPNHYSAEGRRAHLRVRRNWRLPR